METLFRLTVRNEQDEVFEFDSTQPVVHIELPPGRFMVTVSCVRALEPQVDTSRTVH